MLAEFLKGLFERYFGVGGRVHASVAPDAAASVAHEHLGALERGP